MTDNASAQRNDATGTGNEPGVADGQQHGNVAITDATELVNVDRFIWQYMKKTGSSWTTTIDDLIKPPKNFTVEEKNDANANDVINILVRWLTECVMASKLNIIILIHKIQLAILPEKYLPEQPVGLSDLS